LGRDLPSEAVVVSPDEGGVKKARRVAATLGARLAVAYHQDSAGGGTESYLAGDVEGRSPIVVEDMITTGRSVAGVCDL
jgi:ribose-phosphate pyrophosphokinase